MENPRSWLFLWNECFICVFLCPKVPLISQICSKCIHNVLFSPLSLSLLSVPDVCYMRPECLSFCHLPMQVCIHSHVTCQVSMKANPQPKECVCVWGWGGQIWLKLWRHTGCHVVGSDQSPMLTVCDQWNQHKPNVECFFEDMFFSSAQAKIYWPEWIFSKCIFHHISGMNIKNKDWALQYIAIRKEAYLVIQLPIF